MASGQTWDRHQIAAEVKRRGSTLSAISLQAGLPEAACRNALIRKYQAAERAIGRFLGVPLWELWPDRWRSDGSRIDHRTRAHIRPERTRNAVKNSKAA
ncbi:transcriptional regulator [Roseospira marina]|uniref:Transcriptional regulator n=1 Tax=Roseospira marina TaxID=140057 RepID=A0A5M6I671_9PROT|nr:helix-turn-helix domain-containing protein [Roseospira marina]KAA5603746.1 transcriptional regulator [Roseospira marina]MBB4316064.1 lambda repressor-like predicted transcriptional regulator [Roseospira marina]MBB5089218.1 lambda repressor-like predicted transcriptional regulator [Roseospira marina]